MQRSLLLINSTRVRYPGQNGGNAGRSTRASGAISMEPVPSRTRCVRVATLMSPWIGDSEDIVVAQFDSPPTRSNSMTMTLVGENCSGVTRFTMNRSPRAVSTRWEPLPRASATVRRDVSSAAPTASSPMRCLATILPSWSTTAISRFCSTDRRPKIVNGVSHFHLRVDVDSAAVMGSAAL